MKVLLVANVLPPRDLSGAGEQVLQLAWGLRQAGCEVEILGRDQCGPGVSKTSFPWSARRAALRRVAEWQPDVVQVHESDGGLVIRDLSRRATGRRPLLAALQQVSYVQERLAVRPLIDRDGRAGVVARPARSERIFRSLRAPVHIALGRITARRADVRLAPSQVTAAEIERDYGVAGVEVVPNVTGAPLDLPDEDEPRESRVDELVEEPFLLAVGRLRIRKGFEILLRAVATAHGRGHRPRLIVAGDGERRESLSVLARELGLGTSVHFAGRCSRTEVARLRRRATALVVPSTYEGMPLVVLEAMGDAVPVIASAVSGIPEVVVDGETGWLVPPERSSALADALIAATLDPDESRRRGEAGGRRLDRRYRPGHAAERWLEALERVGRSLPPVWKNPDR
ncbi:MAG: glycosyltransferase family 4 protein [Acidobacteria bacterium]|nr:glycosyltransferase family 4 protein [Acidobacteriota bacterium]